MNIEYGYLGDLLGIFIDSDTAHINILEFEGLGIKPTSCENDDFINEKFMFHLQLAIENGLISNRDLIYTDLKSVGINFTACGRVIFSDKPIRLTQKGHDFSKAINNKEIISKLKSELKDAPFKVIFDGSQKLLQHYFAKKIDEIME